jgi:hypothetical protein
MDTASSAVDRTAATAHDLKNRAVEAASHTAGRAAEVGQDMKNCTTDTVYSATDRMGAKGHGTSAQSAGDPVTAAPNTLDFDQNGFSKDRRTQLHPLDSGSVNTAL